MGAEPAWPVAAGSSFNEQAGKAAVSTNARAEERFMYPYCVRCGRKSLLEVRTARNRAGSAAALVIHGGARPAIGGGQEQHMASARALARCDTHHFVVEAGACQAALEARAGTR